MRPHFRDARDLIAVAAARAACERGVGGRAGQPVSWYVAQVGLGVPNWRLARWLRSPASIIRRTVRSIEDSRDADDVDAALARIERRAVAWAM